MPIIRCHAYDNMPILLQCLQHLVEGNLFTFATEHCMDVGGVGTISKPWSKQVFPKDSVWTQKSGCVSYDPPFMVVNLPKL